MNDEMKAVGWMSKGLQHTLGKLEPSSDAAAEYARQESAAMAIGDWYTAERMNRAYNDVLAQLREKAASATPKFIVGARAGEPCNCTGCQLMREGQAAAVEASWPTSVALTQSQVEAIDKAEDALLEQLLAKRGLGAIKLSPENEEGGMATIVGDESSPVQDIVRTDPMAKNLGVVAGYGAFRLGGNAWQNKD